ncbi:MAG: acyltransferase family protein [Bacteroidales bacterium]|nr:acyltransferase family protein [Bacteroidales bacterium]
MERNKNIDLLKGILIMLVITGHIIQDKVDGNLARYLIYSFHMPLFIGISGYLVKLSKLRNLSFAVIANKYLFRVVIPWVFAVFAYAIAVRWHELNDTGSFFSILGASFIKPYLHLWFIPAFLSWVFMSWAIGRYRLEIRHLLIISAIYSLVFVFLREFHGLLTPYPLTGKASEIFLHTFRPYYFIFFAFGMYIRERPGKLIPYMECIPFISLGIAGLVLLFYYPDRILEVPLNYLLNFCLIYFMISSSQKKLLPPIGIIEWIGINSLGIYLWHVMAILLIKELVGTEDKTLFYVVAIIAEILFFALYAALSKLSLINKYLFGMLK